MDDRLRVLDEGLRQIEKGLARLESSYQSCTQLNLTEEVSDDELKELESLSARFARVVDLFTHKVLKTFYIVTGEELLTFNDRINFAEKIGLIGSAREWIVIRSVRNQIVHDYVEEDLVLHHEQILDLSKVVDTDMKTFVDYVREKVLTENDS